MLTVKTIEEIHEIINTKYQKISNSIESVSLLNCCGKVLAENIVAKEYVPSFNRSTVDGYALIASDTFGCSDSIPSILKKENEVFMGENIDFKIEKSFCAPIPTGGQVPSGADAVQMIEYSEDYQDNTIGILKPSAPGQNIIFKGDDVCPNQIVLSEGRILSAHDIGALAALGYEEVKVYVSPKVGIISTGNELVEINQVPQDGQVRDVNSSLLASAIKNFGGVPICYGIFKDSDSILNDILKKAVSECDVILISGGSSVGIKDATCKVIESQGEIFAHGIALKPGKPTIVGCISNVPVIGLPGHPVAAFYATHLVVYPLLEKISNLSAPKNTVTAYLSEPIESNHGRTQCVGVTMAKDLESGKVIATPIRTKSGLITTLAGTDGYFVIPRDCEGLNVNEEITIYIY